MSSLSGADAETSPAEASPTASGADASTGFAVSGAATDPSAPASVRSEIFGPQRRATTIGVLLLISMVAFEAMGVGTAMPALVADLGALSLYAWPFVTFMAASVFGTALGGYWCDRAGPRVALVVSPVLFAVGLLVAGSASGIAQLLVGRVLQGLGAGGTTVAIYVLIAYVYPERTRPAVFGAMSSAWVLPSLVGPPVSGFVTERFSWHWVFIGLVPVAGLAIALVIPAVRRLGAPPQDATLQDTTLQDTTPHDGNERAHSPSQSFREVERAGSLPLESPVGLPLESPLESVAKKDGARGSVLPAAFGAALGVPGLSWAGQHPGPVAMGVVVVAAAVLVPSMRRLLPVGVFRGMRGVPTVVACRGLLAGGFFTANAYLPLMLTSTHHWSLTAAGTPLVVSALGWSSASAWQGNHPDLPRPRLLRIGFALVVFGLAGMVTVAAGWTPGWLALVMWTAAGVGMGLGFSAVSFLMLQQSVPSAVGFNSSAAQMADQLTTATMIGLGGALLALLAAPAQALPALFAVLVVLAGTGVAVASRSTNARRGQPFPLSEG